MIDYIFVEYIVRLSVRAVCIITYTRHETAEYNHFLFGKIGVRRDDFETSDQRPLKIIMRDKWLSDSGFDCVRDTEEFKKIISTLE